MLMTGKFQLDRNENFKEHLLALGIPPQKANAADKLKPILEISLEDNKLMFSSYSGQYNHKTVLTLDKEVDETVAVEYRVKSTARIINDHTIEIISSGEVSEKGIRRYEFTESSMIMTIENGDNSIPVAKRYYTKLDE